MHPECLDIVAKKGDITQHTKGNPTTILLAQTIKLRSYQHAISDRHNKKEHINWRRLP
jgi:hypothetical protein